MLSLFIFCLISFPHRGRASWIPKRRSSSRGRNTRSPPHPHGASTRTHTNTHQSSHILRDSGGHDRAHTDSYTHTRACTHTHADTIEVSGVLAGPVGGWGDFFFFSFCFFNLFISCLFLVNWGTLGTGVGDGCNTSTALLRALAHHCISDDTVDIYWVCRSHSCPLWTEAATKEWCQDNNSQKSSY